MGDVDGLVEMFRQMKKEADDMRKRYINPEDRSCESCPYRHGQPHAKKSLEISYRAKEIHASPVNC